MNRRLPAFLLALSVLFCGMIFPLLSQFPGKIKETARFAFPPGLCYTFSENRQPQNDTI